MKASTELDPVRVQHFSASYRRPQIWYDGWRGADRIIRFVGDCVVPGCGRPTFAADDGENDPRGVMGDNTTHALTATEYGMVGPDVAVCAICGNEYNSYKFALDFAQHEVWKWPEEVSTSRD